MSGMEILQVINLMPLVALTTSTVAVLCLWRVTGSPSEQAGVIANFRLSLERSTSNCARARSIADGLALQGPFPENLVGEYCRYSRGYYGTC
jgi:hypothetical protein